MDFINRKVVEVFPDKWEYRDVYKFDDEFTSEDMLKYILSILISSNQSIKKIVLEDVWSTLDGGFRFSTASIEKYMQFSKKLANYNDLYKATIIFNYPTFTFDVVMFFPEKEMRIFHSEEANYDLSWQIGQWDIEFLKNQN